MLQRAVGTAISLLIVAIAYSGYAMLVVPWIEPAGTSRNELITDDQWLPMTPHLREELARLFPPGSWQLDSPTIIESSYGTLIFKKNIRTDETLEIKPCTLVVYVPQSAGHQDVTNGQRRKSMRRAYVLDAPDGAVLEHEGNFDLNQTRGGRILGGRLLGKVSIHSAATSAISNDSVHIVTRNIQIDRQRIWTPHEVQFQIGPHHGSGRDMVITLARVKNPDNMDQRPDIFNTIDSMELIEVDAIHVQLKRRLVEGSIQTSYPTTTATAGNGKPTPVASSIPVEIRCQGPLRLDLRKQVVSLEKHVDVLIHHPEGPEDQLTCQRLDLQFKPQTAPLPLPADRARQDSSSPETSQTSLIEPIELAAIGDPVILRAPSVGALARAQRILLNIPHRRILLRDVNQARIVQNDHELLAPHIEYQFSTDPKRLGQFFAEGPGRYEGKSHAATRPEFMASWQQNCRLVKEQGQHVFSLIGKAQISQLNYGTVQADDLHIWFRENPVAQPVTVQPTLNPASTLGKEVPEPVTPIADNNTPSETGYRISPQKMAFRGNVQIDTHQLSARTNLLEAWFRYPTVVATRNNPGKSATPPNSPSRITLPTSTTNSKLDVAGEHLRLQVALQDPRPAITDLTIDGNVSLRQLMSSPTNATGFQLQAHSLQLSQKQNGLSSLAIRGQEQAKRPAEIQAGSVKLIGMDIHVDQQVNRMWVTGPGEMHLLQQQAIKPAKPANTTKITWEKRLDFDGQTMTLEKNVVTSIDSHGANGQTTRTHISGALLQTTLSRQLNLRQPDQSTPLQLRRLTYGGGVNIVNKTHSHAGQPLSVDQLHVHSMTLDQRSGDLQAIGPGWGSSIRVDPRQGRAAPNAGEPVSPPGLVYVRIQFEHGIIGNTIKRNIRFYRRVKTLYGPVLDWNTQLNPNNPGGLGPQGIQLDSDQLEIVDLQQKGRQSILLEATGNTTIDSMKYAANAHRMTYAQSNSLLTLEGDRFFAQLFIKPNKKGTPDALARKIMYWFDTNRLQVEGASSVNIGRFQGIGP